MKMNVIKDLNNMKKFKQPKNKELAFSDSSAASKDETSTDSKLERYRVYCKLDVDLDEVPIDTSKMSFIEKAKFNTDCFKAYKGTEIKCLSKNPLDTNSAEEAIKLAFDYLIKFYSDIESCTCESNDSEIFVKFSDCRYRFYDFETKSIPDNETLRKIREMNKILRSAAKNQMS